MINGKKIVIVLPAYNAGQTLEITYKEIPFDIVDEVVLVDDRSRDNTVEVAHQIGIKHVIQHEQNKGYGGNQKTCYDTALKLGGDIVIMLHPDYQYTPLLIQSMAYRLLMEKVAQREQTEKKMEREFKERQEKLKKEFSEIEKIKQRFAKDDAIMSEEEKIKLSKEGQERVLNFKNAENKFNQDLNQTRNEEQQKLFKFVTDAVQAVAREENYDLILESASTPFAKDSFNVTAKVASKLESGSGGGKPTKK